MQCRLTTELYARRIWLFSGWLGISKRYYINILVRLRFGTGYQYHTNSLSLKPLSMYDANFPHQVFELRLEGVFSLRYLDKYDPDLSMEATEGNANIMIPPGSVPDSSLIEALWLLNIHDMVLFVRIDQVYWRSGPGLLVSTIFTVMAGPHILVSPPGENICSPLRKPPWGYFNLTSASPI